MLLYKNLLFQNKSLKTKLFSQVALLSSIHMNQETPARSLSGHVLKCGPCLLRDFSSWAGRPGSDPGEAASSSVTWGSPFLFWSLGCPLEGGGKKHSPRCRHSDGATSGPPTHS